MIDAVIVDGVRLPAGRGKVGGALSGMHPVDLMAHLLSALIERNDLDSAEVDDVMIGCLAQVGEQSVNLARNAVLAAGFPETVPGTTIDRQCGSSLQAAAFAAATVGVGLADVVIAGGVEMMSKYPIGYATLGQDPFGARIDQRYPGGLVGQGVSAELVAARWNLNRTTLDEFAEQSHRRAAASATRGDFDREIVPIPVRDVEREGETKVHAADETIRANTNLEALAALKPSFRASDVSDRFPEIKDWRITPGNASPLTDSASALLISNAAASRRLGLRPRARIVDLAVVGSDPIEMLTGIIPATRKVLARNGLSIDDIDAYEVNEAFAPVPLAWLHDLGADPDRLNVRGGAIALGHALGATGSRLLTTLINVLEDTGGRYGLVAICEAQGMANVAIIERIVQ